MHIIEVIKKLETSKEFSAWKKSHKEAYLAHAFISVGQKEDLWQIGYFNPKTNLISVFVIDKKITKNEDAEVFKEQEKLVNPLILSEIKINEDEAIAAAMEILSKNYKGATLFKTFMILQNIESFDTVWNVTFLTEQFKTINVKIDAKTGKCTAHKEVSLIQGKE